MMVVMFYSINNSAYMLLRTRIAVFTCFLLSIVDDLLVLRYLLRFSLILFQKVSKLSVVQLCTHSIKVYTEATSFYTKQNKKYTVNGGKNQITFLRLPLTQQHFHSIPHQFYIIFMKENKCVFQENWTQLLQHIITQSTLLIS